MGEHDIDEQAAGRLDAAFQALPPLGSAEYLARVGGALPSDLPPELLVRALRQLPADSVAWNATLDRLFRGHETGQGETRWDYLGPLVAYARRQASRGKRDEYGDLLQDAFARILKVLLTPRGKFAERAWHSFCRRELSDAWREHYGRRGERFPQEKAVGIGLVGDDTDPLAEIAAVPPWHAVTERNDVQRIEAIAQRVLAAIPDEFVRSVATIAWFQSERPRISGRSGKRAPLSARFPGKSRYQLMRALRHADSQLAAALLDEPHLEWTVDLRRLLETLTGEPAAGRRRRTQERA